jgi:hypothetical protein
MELRDNSLPIGKRITTDSIVSNILRVPALKAKFTVEHGKLLNYILGFSSKSATHLFYVTLFGGVMDPKVF